MSSEETQKKTTKKRKRTKNTSTEQNEIYIHFMENDYHFRSGTINPTLGENYMKKKWEELTNKLNAAGDGPHLSVVEWKKRFTDWKYALRVKYRKLSEHRTKTGSGPESEIKLTPIEDRALSVWGRVVVTGSPFISVYDGLAAETTVNENVEPNSLFTAEGHTDLNISNIADDTSSVAASSSVPIYNLLPDAHTSMLCRDTFKPTQLNNEQLNSISAGTCAIDVNTDASTPSNTRQRSYASRPKPLSILVEKLLATSSMNEKNSQDLNSVLKQFAEDYKTLKREKNHIDILKLKFEVAKYKFENPNFCFDDI